MTPGTRAIPDALLERYLADALPAEARARLEAMLAGSPGDQLRLAELRADSAAFLLQRPPRLVVERFQKEQGRTRRWLWPSLLVPALVAAALVLVHLPLPPDPYIAKGTVLLVMHRQAGDRSIRVTPNVPLSPGDTLGFEVKAAASGFVAVLSRDAQGIVSVYFPYGGAEAAPYDASKPVLPEAVELDDTLGREDIYVLYSARPFGLEWAVRALEQGQSLRDVAPQEVAVEHSFFVKQRSVLQK